MFYCKPCAGRNKWPESMSRSYGKCEVCGKSAECYDVPSRCLPMPSSKEPKVTKTELPMPKKFEYQIPLSEFYAAFGIDPSETPDKGVFLPDAFILTTRKEP